MKPADGESGAAGRIEREIGSLRSEIDELVNELDRRRRDAFDVRLQLHRHPAAATVACVALAAALGGTIALVVYNGRRKQRTSHKARQLKMAMARMMEHPERVARVRPPPGEQILAAVGTALAFLLVKRAFERAVPSAAAQPSPRPSPAAAG